MINIKINRIGEKNINKQGIEMTIIHYRNCSDIDIQFSDGTIANTTYYYFLKGSVPNYNIPSYLGIGYLGYGKYKSRKNNTKTDEYIKWGSMLTRCYSEKLKERRNYIECTVCDEWHNFQNFAEWYNDHKYYLPDVDVLDLDKDIKIKGNKVYSPDTCILIPKRLNSIILNRHNDRGKECIGVFYNHKTGKYISSCNMLNSNQRYLGSFNTEKEAFDIYKKTKEHEIQLVLELYKKYLPIEVYNAILNYKIEIDD